MRANTIHVTNHAFKRWIQRASEYGYSSDDEITEVVKKAKILKKNEDIPYGTKRIRNMVYAVHKDCLFVLEPVSQDEFRLITIINEHTFVYKHKLEKFRTQSKRAVGY